jgi:hypothetical protein
MHYAVGINRTAAVNAHHRSNGRVVSHRRNAPNCWPSPPRHLGDDTTRTAAAQDKYGIPGAPYPPPNRSQRRRRFHCFIRRRHRCAYVSRVRSWAYNNNNNLVHTLYRYIYLCARKTRITVTGYIMYYIPRCNYCRRCFSFHSRIIIIIIPNHRLLFDHMQCARII